MKKFILLKFSLLLYVVITVVYLIFLYQVYIPDKYYIHKPILCKNKSPNVCIKFDNEICFKNTETDEIVKSFDSMYTHKVLYIILYSMTTWIICLSSVIIFTNS